MPGGEIPYALGGDPNFPADGAERLRATFTEFKYWFDDPFRCSEFAGRAKEIREQSTDEGKRINHHEKMDPGADMTYWSENHRLLFGTAEYLAGQYLARRHVRLRSPISEGGTARADTKGRLRRGRAPRPGTPARAPLAERATAAGLRGVERTRLLRRGRPAAREPGRLLGRRAGPDARGDGPRRAGPRPGAEPDGRRLCRLRGPRILRAQELRVGPVGPGLRRAALRDIRGHFVASSNAAIFLATSPLYEPPDVLVELGAHPPGRFTSRGRVSITFEEAGDHGVGFRSPDDMEFWWSRAAYATKQTILASKQVATDSGLLDTPPFKDILPMIESAAKAIDTAEDVGGGILGGIGGAALGFAVGGPAGAIVGGAAGAYAGASEPDFDLVRRRRPGVGDHRGFGPDPRQPLRASLRRDALLASVQGFRPGQLNFQSMAVRRRALEWSDGVDDVIRRQAVASSSAWVRPRGRSSAPPWAGPSGWASAPCSCPTWTSSTKSFSSRTTTTGPTGGPATSSSPASSSSTAPPSPPIRQRRSRSCCLASARTPGFRRTSSSRRSGP